jgi:hypothetical protein
MKYFGRRELQIAKEKLHEAESLLSEYYCIPGREWPLYQYGVRTLFDSGETKISGEVLASISKYEVPNQARQNWVAFDYYEIVLHDDNILAVSSRRIEGISFEALMLYILTHELVHVFRFANLPQRFFAGEQERIREERDVHRITDKILRRRKNSLMASVLDAYQDYPFKTTFSFQSS